MSAESGDQAMRADLLIELGCEELPPKAVDTLREALFSAVADRLKNANIEFDRDSSHSFSTPRRLALLLARVAAKQPDQVLERRGPAVAAAFDADGNPTPAAEGFARSVGLPVSDLQHLETDKGEWLYCEQEAPGQPLEDLLFDILAESLRQLPVPRPMRWADHDFSFVRPVHWVVVLHGNRVLKGAVLGKAAGRKTRGHRIHGPGPHELTDAGEYVQTLLDANVVADPQQRRERIVAALESAEAGVIIDPDLLDEVNNLVEWPIAVACRFDESFLEVPHAALIASMQDHQKFFPVGDDDGQGDGNTISNRFVAISNIDSTDVTQVRVGFERVIRPRLADARFFLEQDQQKPLADYARALDGVVFQEKIGSIGDKTRRVSELSRILAGFLGIDSSPCQRAAALCKCDLMTQMVNEFPELQGQMGAYYARTSGETDEVAVAIGEHYAPRFAGDAIPSSPPGQVLSLADRADTLVACFAAGLAPSGNKDPFALRRAALGMIRILSEASLAVPIPNLLAWASKLLPDNLDASDGLQESVEAFIIQRARGHYRDKGYSTELVSAVLAAPWATIPDLDARLAALDDFMGRPEAAGLAAANKRIGNILRKSEYDGLGKVNESLLNLDEEKALFEDVRRISEKIEPFIADSNYPACLEALAALKTPVDAFFDTVLVMDEDIEVQRNRLALLAQMKALFDNVADLSVLG